MAGWGWHAVGACAGHISGHGEAGGGSRAEEKAVAHSPLGVGMGMVVLACLNIFIELHVYELITATSLLGVNVAFSVQVALMALLYLAQDKYVRQVQWALPQKATIGTGQDVQVASSQRIPSCKGPVHMSAAAVAAPSSPFLTIPSCSNKHFLTLTNI
ncbi:hypothetical protein L7F22_026747 [Adiantum nelumboides]|nr:hypothetical protein [Adiantum nelumboides]